jgi:hypothetical protein
MSRSFSRWAAAGLYACDQGSAKLAVAAAAIHDKKGWQSARPLKIDEINDRAAIFAKGHEASAGKDADVKGERVLRQFEPSRDVARCHALWLPIFPYIEKYGRMVHKSKNGA